MDLSDIKPKIDSIWDVFWTGGITNSITIAEQMTYLLFMKMLDDAQIKREAAAMVIGAPVSNPTFPSGEKWKNPDTDEEVDYQLLRWKNFIHLDKWIDSRKKEKTLAEFIKENVFVFIKNLSQDGETAYSKFMGNASFLVDNNRILLKVVKEIDELDLNNKDIMGDFYEYILNKMAASGNNGQFRTPRQIIDMMVRMMQPKIDDTICDPAMGSAGFIVGCAKYVKENYKSEIKKKENADHYKNLMFNGFDTDQTMLRIGTMNLMLHDVDNPTIKNHDSLSDENKIDSQYSLIMANPPFTGSIDNEAVSKSLLDITKTKKTELLFVALFIRMLKNGGRCASIVPDGVLFGNSTGHKAIRKQLVDNHQLQAVISMPSGIFQPYSGVSTAIIIFTKTGNGGTGKVWFYDMKSDGRSLDQKRTLIDENGGDIPDIVNRFHNLEAEASRSRKEQSFLVDVDEIRKNDYDLSINKYKEVERVKVEYESPEVVMSRISELQNAINSGIEEYKQKYM